MIVSEPDLAWHAKFDPEGRIRSWWGSFQQNRAGYLAVEQTYYDLTLYRVVDAGP